MLGYCAKNLSEFNKIKKNVMGGACGTYVWEEWRMQILIRETWGRKAIRKS
jgi:hypothetical protein